MVPIPRITNNDESDIFAALFRSRVDFAMENRMRAGPVM